jgi:hypothetical protein
MEAGDRRPGAARPRRPPDGDLRRQRQHRHRRWPRRTRWAWASREDLSLVGYNDIPVVSRLPVPLTTVRVPFGAIAVNALTCSGGADGRRAAHHRRGADPHPPLDGPVSLTGRHLPT